MLENTQTETKMEKIWDYILGLVIHNMLDLKREPEKEIWFFLKNISRWCIFLKKRFFTKDNFYWNYFLKWRIKPSFLSGDCSDRKFCVSSLIRLKLRQPEIKWIKRYLKQKSRAWCCDRMQNYWNKRTWYGGKMQVKFLIITMQFSIKKITLCFSIFKYKRKI